MSRTFKASLAAALLTAILPSLAAAADAPASTSTTSAGSPQEVNELIRKGHDAMRGNRFREAIDFFDKARVLTGDSPRTVGEVGFAEQGLGDWISSEGHLRSALSHADDPWVKQHQDVLQNSLKVVQQHIGELVVTGPEGAIVGLDSRSIGKLPMDPVHLVEGKYKVLLKPNTTAEPCSPVKEFEIAGGKRVAIELSCERPAERAEAAKAKATVPAARPPVEPPAPLVDKSPPIRFGAREWSTLGASFLITGGIASASVGGLFIHDGGVDRNKGPWLVGAGAAGIVVGGVLAVYALTHDAPHSAGTTSALGDGAVLRF